jgi:hypothetical protein
MTVTRLSLKLVFAVSALLLITPAQAAETTTLVTNSDPHRNEMGFFDIHVCNWKDRELFFLSLFSSTRFKDIDKIELFMPDGRKLGEIGTKRYRLIQNKRAPEKRVFISNIDIPANAGNGWYSARVTATNGKVYTAQDYVVIETMQRAKGRVPGQDAEDIPMPKELKWDPIPGAKHYQVFIKDMWDGDKVILESKLLDKPRLELPKGLLKPGGFYTWRVHSRDVNENVILGDFNHGSLTEEYRFTIAAE